MKRVIVILLFDGVEVLDFAGPYEVFAAACDESAQPYTRVFTVANRPEVKCHGGLRVLADATFDNCPAFRCADSPGRPWRPRKKRATENDHRIHSEAKR